MWPRGSGQIHTSVHAGGMASARIRLSSASPLIGRPFGAKYVNPSAFIFRVIPGRSSRMYRNPAVAAAATPSGADVDLAVAAADALPLAAILIAPEGSKS